MPVDEIIEIDQGTIASGGGTSEDEYTANKNYTILKLISTEESGAALEDIDSTITIDGNVKTRDSVDLSIFNEEYPDSPPLNWEFDDSSTIKFSTTNNQASNRDVVLFLLCEVRE